MIVIEKKYLSNPVKKGEKSRVIADIFVDTADELPAYNSNDNFNFVQGSVAYAVKSGEIFIMGSDGKWYDTSGTVKE